VPQFLNKTGIMELPEMREGTSGKLGEALAAGKADGPAGASAALAGPAAAAGPHGVEARHVL